MLILGDRLPDDGPTRDVGPADHVTPEVVQEDPDVEGRSMVGDHQKAAVGVGLARE